MLLHVLPSGFGKLSLICQFLHKFCERAINEGAGMCNSVVQMSCCLSVDFSSQSIH